MVLVNAATLIAELGDLSRFDDPRQVSRPRQLSATYQRSSDADPRMIDDRASCLARKKRKQALARKPLT